MKKIIYTQIFFLFIGCSTIPKNDVNNANINNKTIQLTNHTKIPNADYNTASEVFSQTLLGIPGLLIRQSKHYNYGVIDIGHTKDPAIYLKNEIAQILLEKYNLRIIMPERKVVDATKLKSTKNLLQEYKEGDLLLDVHSKIYGKYYPARLEDFRTYYKASVRLIDRERKKVIYNSSCVYDKKEDNDFTLREIKEDKNVLPSILERAKHFCLSKFAADFKK